MGDGPKTPYSLLARLRDHRHVQAWSDFLEIYRPLVYRLVRQRGLQHADAEELTQEALIAVAGAIERWEPNPEKGSFRGWLFRIARNMVINFLSRSRPENQGIGGEAFEQVLAEQAAEGPEEATTFGLEYHRQVFAWAARQVRREFQESTWQAFWKSSVERQEIPRVACDLGLSVGAVYTQRSRGSDSNAPNRLNPIEYPLPSELPKSASVAEDAFHLLFPIRICACIVLHPLIRYGLRSAAER